MKGKRPLFFFALKRNKKYGKQNKAERKYESEQSRFASKNFKRNRRTLLGTREKLSIITRYVDFVIPFLTKSV